MGRFPTFVKFKDTICWDAPINPEDEQKFAIRKNKNSEGQSLISILSQDMCETHNKWNGLKKWRLFCL
jgi:hypothetical protein